MEKGTTTPLTPEQIIQAAIDPPAATLRMTDETTDEELSAFIRGKQVMSDMLPIGEYQA